MAISQRFVAAVALHVSFKIAEEGGGVDDGMRTLRVQMMGGMGEGDGDWVLKGIAGYIEMLACNVSD